MPKWRQDGNGFVSVAVKRGEEIQHLGDALRIHNADIDALTAERDAWRNAVIDAAVVNWTYTAEDEDNPYLAVCKLLACAAQEALDPQIGLDAKALHDRIAELQRRLDAVVMSLKPGEKPVREKLMDYEEWSLVLDRYAESKRIHTRALAIAEGREE